ncbi:MAG: hypothetical protein ACTHME_08620 [Candidatus Nitrosocosmicus sp.]
MIKQNLANLTSSQVNNCHAKQKTKFNVTLNSRNRDIYFKLRKIAKKKGMPMSDLLLNYAAITMENLEKNKRKDDVTKEEVQKNPHIPSLNNYHKFGIGGKNIINAIRKGLVSKTEATDIISSAHILVTEVTRSTGLSRFCADFSNAFDFIQSRRHIERSKRRVQFFYNKVQECVEKVKKEYNEMSPLEQRYLEPPPHILPIEKDYNNAPSWESLNEDIYEEIENPPPQKTITDKIRTFFS